MPLAVIDFETMGLVPERADRVVEVGIVLTDDDGGIEHERTTLVNLSGTLGHRTFTVGPQLRGLG